METILCSFRDNTQRYNDACMANLDRFKHFYRTLYICNQLVPSWILNLNKTKMWSNSKKHKEISRHHISRFKKMSSLFNNTIQHPCFTLFEGSSPDLMLSAVFTMCENESELQFVYKCCYGNEICLAVVTSRVWFDLLTGYLSTRRTLYGYTFLVCFKLCRIYCDTIFC